MSKHEMVGSGGGSSASKVTRRQALGMPQLIGAASLLGAGASACWLRLGGILPTVSPLRALGLVVVGAYLVAAVLLLLEER